MAQRVVVSYTDDLDGSQADDTVTFQLDGNHYEIDLSSVNAQQLRDVLEPYVAAARGRNASRPSRGRGPGAGARGSSEAEARTEARRNAGEMRHWLADNGYSVKERGRIPGELADAYRSDTPAGANTSIAPVFKAAI